jgi:hypothetical protein
MDALSDALNSVRMTGAIFFDAICNAPWGFAVPPMEQVAPVLSPGTEHLVGYHLVAEGKATVRLDKDISIPIAAGDIVIFPHGDAHTVTNGARPQSWWTAASRSEVSLPAAISASSGSAAEARRRASSVAISAANALPSGCFSRDCLRSSR